MAGHSHRSGLKKDKKAFKSRHASKGQLKARNQGKVEKTRPSANSKKNRANNKIQRKNNAKQLKEKKIMQALENKKLFQSASGVEKIVTIVSLTSDIDEDDLLNQIIDVGLGLEDEKSMISGPSITTVKFTKFKSNYKFILPKKSSFLSILDAARVSDFVIFALSAEEEVDPQYGEQIVRAIELQGVSNAFCVVPNLDTEGLKEKHQKGILGSLSSYFKHFFPNEDKIYSFKSATDLSKLVHHLSSIVPKGVNWLKKRGYILADNVALENDNTELSVVGTVRGAGFYVNQLVDVPSVGQLRVKYIEKLDKKTNEAQVIDAEIEVENENDVSDLVSVTDSQGNFDDDDMMSDFGDEDDEDLMQYDNDFNDFGTFDNNGAAETFLDPEDDEFDPEIEDLLSGKHQTKAGNGGPEIELAETEEKRHLDLFLEESEDPGSTEELHLDPRESAIERLKRYRSSLLEFDVDEVDEKTPEEWNEMLRIRNFRVSTNRAFKLFNKKKQVSLGDKVKLHLELLPEQAPVALERMSKMDSFDTVPFTVFGLLKNEDKKSLCNFSFKAWEAYTKPISSKDVVVVQYGSRRQVIEPMYSVNSNTSNNIHKYLRFSLPGVNSIASAIVPINFGRVPVLFYKTNNEEFPEKLELIGSGTLENIDHSRTLVKRKLLVGQPLKIHKRMVTLRFMFFNPADVNYFKSVPLFTKSGATGYIRESLGTHGYFKASFNKKLSAQDYVYMALYKRIWPRGSSEFVQN